MRLSDTFMTHETDGQQLLIDLSGRFSGLVRSNRTAARIVDCLREETTAENIVDTLCAEYDAPRDVIERDVLSIIEKLRSIGAIDA